MGDTLLEIEGSAPTGLFTPTKSGDRHHYRCCVDRNRLRLAPKGVAGGAGVAPSGSRILNSAWALVAGCVVREGGVSYNFRSACCTAGRFTKTPGVTTRVPP